MPRRGLWIQLRRGMRRLSRFLRYRVLHVDDTPHRIALGVAIGLFVTWTPTIGLQMVLALALCTLLRANKAVGLPFVWISNPLTILPIYYPSYALGLSLIPGRQPKTWAHWNQMVREVFGSDLGWWDRTVEFWRFALDVAVPLWLGSLIMGTIIGVAAYSVTYRAVIRYRAALARRREARLARRRDRAAHSASPPNAA